MHLTRNWFARAPGLREFLVIAVFLCQVAAGYGQGPATSRFDVRGEIQNLPPGLPLRVTLWKTTGPGIPLSADVSLNGQFELGGVEVGTYTLRVTDSSGITLHETLLSIAGPYDYLTVSLPPPRGERPLTGTVSVRELQQKVAPKALKEHEKGLRDFRSGNFNRAIEHFRKAATLDPSYADPHSMLGMSLSSLGRADLAAEEFRLAAQLAPDSADVAGNLALAMATLHRYPECETAARAALKVDRDLKRARFLLGYSLYKQGKNDQEAIENLQWAAILYSKAYLFAAEILSRLGRLGEAAGQLRRYLNSSAEADRRREVEAWLADLTKQAPSTAGAVPAAEPQP